MNLRVLRGATPWLLAVLIGAATYAGMQARYYAGQASDAEARVVRSEQRAEILLEHQRWQRRQLDAMTAALDAREEQLVRDAEIIGLVRQAARHLERDDAETAAWADQPSPDAVREWLRQLSAGADDGAGAGDARRAAVPAGPAAGAEPAGDAQP